jgi:multidrug efflux pump subunit AcrA (membrane-fusion protein)
MMKIPSLVCIVLFIVGCQKEMVNPVKGNIIEAVYGLGIIRSEKNYHAKAAIVNSVARFYVVEGHDVKKNDPLFVTDQGAIHRAPFDGKVTDIPVTVSENLFPQSLILSLVDLKNLYLEVSLEQQAVLRLKQGLSAEISFEFFRNQKLIGNISSIYPKNDQFVAKVLLEKWPHGVLPGMSADVAFEVASKQNVTLIPTNAIANGHIVVKRNNQKLKLKVQIGIADEEKTEIISPELFSSDEILIP